MYLENICCVTRACTLWLQQRLNAGGLAYRGAPRSHADLVRSPCLSQHVQEFLALQTNIHRSSCPVDPVWSDPASCRDLRTDPHFYPEHTALQRNVQGCTSRSTKLHINTQACCVILQCKNAWLNKTRNNNKQRSKNCHCYAGKIATVLKVFILGLFF